MATYYVWDGGTNGAGTDWTSAKTTLAGAIALATASGDVIKVAHTHTGDNALAVDTTWTAGNHIAIISVDKTSSDAPTVMGTSAWLGSSSASISLNVAGGYRIYLYGLTFRNAGSTNKSITLGGTDGAQVEASNCYLWLGTTNTSSGIVTGTASGANNGFAMLENCTLRFGATAQTMYRYARLEMKNCSVSSAGSAPTALFGGSGYGESKTVSIGCDFSHLGSNTLVGNNSSGCIEHWFIQCKLGTNFVAKASPSSPSNKGNVSVYVIDCSSGDTHGFFGYYDAAGSIVSDTSINVTSGVAAQSWKIVTTANCSYYTPFVSPWIGYWNTSTSSMTPYFDILRSGSSTAYQDNEIWAEFCSKTNANTTQGAFYSDKMALLGTPSNQATSSLGAGDWTGESGTSWFGKIDSGSSFTPAEVGEVMGRVYVGVASATVYVDPVIK